MLNTVADNQSICCFTRFVHRLVVAHPNCAVANRAMADVVAVVALTHANCQPTCGNSFIWDSPEEILGHQRNQADVEWLELRDVQLSGSSIESWDSSTVIEALGDLDVKETVLLAVTSNGSRVVMIRGFTAAAARAAALLAAGALRHSGMIAMAFFLDEAQNWAVELETALDMARSALGREQGRGVGGSGPREGWEGARKGRWWIVNEGGELVYTSRFDQVSLRGIVDRRPAAWGRVRVRPDEPRRDHRDQHQSVVCSLDILETAQTNPRPSMPHHAEDREWVEGPGGTAHQGAAHRGTCQVGYPGTTQQGTCRVAYRGAPHQGACRVSN